MNIPTAIFTTEELERFAARLADCEDVVHGTHLHNEFFEAFEALRTEIVKREIKARIKQKPKLFLATVNGRLT